MSESNFNRHFGVDIGFDGDGRSDGTGIGSVPIPTPDVTPDSCVKKHRNTRRLIWQHFTVQKNDPNRANCNYCGANLGCKSSSADASTDQGYEEEGGYYEEEAEENFNHCSAQDNEEEYQDDGLQEGYDN